MSLAITTSSLLTAGSTFTAYSLAFAASGGTAPYTYAVTVGVLPAGLTLSSAGVLSGTPTATGGSTFTVQVTDAIAATATLACELTINATVWDDMVAGLAEADSRLFNMNSSEALATRTIRRYWPDLMISDPTAALAGLEPYRSFLETYTSTFNHPTAHRYVDNPLVEGTPMAGRWRCVSVDIKMQGGVPYIVQTLKLGYLETIVKTVNNVTVYDFAEARLLNPGMFDAIRPYVIIVWQNISPEKVLEVAAAAPTTATNPIIFGSALPAGTWIRKGDVARGSDDGSCFVAITLSLEPEAVTVLTEAQADATGQRTITRTDTREAARALVAAAVIPTTGKILSGNVQRIGEEGSEAQIQERAAVALTTALSVGTTSAFETQAAATDKNVVAAATAPTAPTPPVAVTGKIVTARVEKTEYPGISTKTTEERAAVAATTAMSTATTSATETQAAITDKNVAAAATPPTVPTPPVAVSGKIVTARVDKTEFPGIVNKTTEERAAVEQLLSQKTKETSAVETVATASDRHVATGDTPAVPTPDAPTTGKIVTISEEKTEFPDKVVAKKTERTAVKLAGAVSTTTVARADTSASITDRNAATGDGVPTAPTPPVATTGKIVTIRIDKTEFPSVENKTVEEKAAVAMTGAVSAGSASALEQSSSITDKNVLDAATAPTPEAAPASVTGKIVQTRTDKTDYPGVSNKTVEHKIAVKLATATSVTVVSAAETQASITDRNAATGDAAPTAPTPPSPTTGKIVTIRTDKTEYPGIDNKTVEERTAVAQATAVSRATTSASSTDAMAPDRNVAAAATPPTAPAAPSPETGKVVTDVVEKSAEYPGTVTKTREERAAVAQTTAVSRGTRTATEKVTVITDRNVAAAATPPTAPAAPNPVNGKVVTDTVEKSTEYPGTVNKTHEEDEAVARNAAFLYPGLDALGQPLETALRDWARTYENITDAALQTILDALPVTVAGNDGFVRNLNYSVSPGVSRYPGLVTAHVRCSVGAIVNAGTNAWLNYVSGWLTTKQEQYSHDLTQVRRRSRFVCVTQTCDHTAAYAAAYAPKTNCFCAPECRVEDHGNGHWRAVNVSVELIWGAWGAAQEQ